MTGTNTFTNADLVGMIPELWPGMVLPEFFAATSAAQWFVQLEASEGDIIHVPDVYTNAHSVSTQNTQGAELTLNSPTQNDVTLTINNHVYVAYIIDDLARAQLSRNFDVAMEYARKAGGTLATDLESDIFALWSGLTTNSVGDTASVLSDAEVRQAVEKLDTLNIPLDECAWFLHPYVYWNQLNAISKYYDQGQFSRSVPGLTLTGTLDGRSLEDVRGLRGSLYGIPLFVTSNVKSGLQTYRNLLAHRTAFGYAIQTPGGRIRTQADYLLQNLGVLTVHDMINGVTELRDQAAVVVNANSAFIGS